MKKHICYFCIFILLIIFPQQGCWRTPYSQDAVHQTFLAESLANYTDVNGKMPSNITDKDGKSLLSWRVELLKYGSSDNLDLYKQFKLNEAWDSPHNKKVALTVPFMYIDPKGPKCLPLSKEPIQPLWRMAPNNLNYTTYLAVMGNNTPYSLGKLPRKDSEYAAIVVVDKSDVFWTEPRDISLEEVKKGNALRWYGGKTTKYLTPRGGIRDWEKDVDKNANADEGKTPKYEFDDDQ
jgi:hypothetical protein